ncbi:ragulator complex protein LAMTOR3 homolog [Culicoides brevitarsis]|uniref:ragulator complex protein LAMTOR3 homolog n=1 Tax=Culicoides brevitarsis TaxID=469753 RepID=UPI00307C3D95
MSEDIKHYFNGLLQKVSGLYCILVTDRDGVPLVKVANENAPEALMKKPSQLSIFTQCSEQAGKLHLGKNKSIICMYSNYQIIHFNKLPSLIVTFVGSENFNTGYVLSLEEQIDKYLDDLRVAVEASC